MKKMKYIFQRIFHMDFKKMFQVINKIHNKTNKSKIVLFFDIVYCGFKYQAGYMDYDLFAMYDLNKEERKTILTRGKNNSYVKRLNPKEYWHIFDNKDEFNQIFQQYLNREYFIITENNYKEFQEFLKNKKQIIVKPLNESCGKGIEKIQIDNKDLKKLYKELKNKKTYLIEEVANQHEKITALHPQSVNTIRIITLINQYQVTTILAAFIRIGTKDNVVDNFNHGGICSPIDLETGKISAQAVDKQGLVYQKHPDTNITLEGYQLPHWEKVKKLVIEASKVIPEMGLIGWDVCIGQEKPMLIEANQFPGHDIYQLPVHRKNNIGMVPVFEAALSKKE